MCLFLTGIVINVNPTERMSLMRTVSVLEAEGMVLCHDITEIVPSKFKGRAFRKGHVVRREDIPRLLDLGKEHLYVMELNTECCTKTTQQ